MYYLLFPSPQSPIPQSPEQIIKIVRKLIRTTIVLTFAIGLLSYSMADAIITLDRLQSLCYWTIKDLIAN